MMIFNRLRRASSKLGAVEAKGEKKLQQLQEATAAETPLYPGTPEPAAAEEEEEEGAPPQTVYVYDGREVASRAAELTTFILAAGFAMPDVRYIKSASDADVRSATWDSDCRAIIFPPMHSLPDFAPNAVKDLRNFVAKGTNDAGTVLFMGSSLQIHVMNQLFGFQMQQDFKEGPYYKNERTTKGTVLAKLPERVNEMGNTQALGILKTSLPPEANSYYDSFGDSVAACVRWDLGRVCYLAQDFGPLQDLPELQRRAESEDEKLSKKAGFDMEILARKTDTWLGIMHGMLEQPKFAGDYE